MKQKKERVGIGDGLIYICMCVQRGSYFVLNLVKFDVRLITYAACLEGSDPVRLFEKRMNARRGHTMPMLLSQFQLLVSISN